MLFVAAQIYLILSIFSFHSHLHIEAIGSHSIAISGGAIHHIHHSALSLIAPSSSSRLHSSHLVPSDLLHSAGAHAPNPRKGKPSGISRISRGQGVAVLVNEHWIRKSRSKIYQQHHIASYYCMWIQNLIRIGGALGWSELVWRAAELYPRFRTTPWWLRGAAVFHAQINDQSQFDEIPSVRNLFQVLNCHGHIFLGGPSIKINVLSFAISKKPCLKRARETQQAAQGHDHWNSSFSIYATFMPKWWSKSWPPSPTNWWS